MNEMLTTNVVREIVPLSKNDCFTIMAREGLDFDIPLHYHDEYELTLIRQGTGAKRIIGNNIGVSTATEIVFVGPNLCHSWLTHQCTSGSINSVTIQFHKDLFDDTFLSKNQLCLFRNMLENAKQGILFLGETANNLADRIVNLKEKTQFEAVLELLSILHNLSISPDAKLLSDHGFSGEKVSHKSKRIGKVFEFINENYEKPITLADVSDIALMPPSSFSRFFKRRTGKTFIECLNEIRLGQATRMLVNTNFTIAEIAYKCGFNNLSNFNRTFKHKKSCIPKDFRKAYFHEKRMYV